MKSAMKSATSRRLLLLVVASCFLLFAHASNAQLEERKPQLQVRQLVSVPQSGTTSPPASTSPTTATTPTTTPAQVTSTTPTTTPASPTTNSQTTTTPPPTTQPTTSTHDTTTSQSSSPPPVTSSPEVITNSSGQTITSFVLGTATSSSATPSSTQTSSSNSSGGLGTGSIIGLSVAGGVAAIAIISFFVWKFTRKRFTDFDDNEAIKWPELNTHGGSGGGDIHALPTNSTGRSGFGAENDSEVNLARAPSPGGYAHSVAALSLPETYSPAQDPYAVPPLPHLNPNQPYHDDPGAYNQPGYYDPYRGPVPNTFGDGFSDGHGPEAIPMTRMARTRSPGPQMTYDVPGRASPGPQAAMGYALDGRSASPAIVAGRTSPGPQVAYGYGPR